MRHLPILLVVLLAGCSTHPIANTMDFFCPGKLYPAEVEPYGGVLNQQGTILTSDVGPPPSVPGVVPPPVPLPGTPGNAPPPNFPPPRP